MNLLIDPANLFSHYERQVAEIQIKNVNAVVTQNFDERLAKKQYIELMKQPKEVLVLGSSRVLGISSDMVGNSSFYNFGVSGAGIYDMIGIISMLDQKQLLPQSVLIGIDPWMFNENNGETRYKTLQKEIDFFFGNKKSRQFIDSKRLEICSPAYLQVAINQIETEGFQPKQHPQQTVQTENEGQTFRFDGSISYNKALRDTTAEQAATTAQKYIQGTVYQLNNFSQMSEQYKSEFNLLIQFLKDNGVQVHLYLAPYHPIVYEHFQKTPEFKPVIDVEEFISEYAEKQDIKRYGSFNPAVTGCTEVDFLDGMHLKTDLAILSKSFGGIN